MTNQELERLKRGREDLVAKYNAVVVAPGKVEHYNVFGDKRSNAQNFIDYVMLEAYIGYRMKINEPVSASRKSPLRDRLK